MTTSRSIQQAADALHNARDGRIPVPRISESYGIHTIEDAYAVAAVNTDRALKAGRRLSGRKIGLTSKAVQQQLGVDQPDYGVLFADMEYVDGDVVPADRLIQPKAEGEVAFVIGRDIRDEELTWGRFLHAIDHALPAIEIVDSAIEDWRITLVDTVADNASCGVYVLGTEPRSLHQLTLAECGMDFLQNGRTVSVGSGAACMGHPLRAAFWLAKTMAHLGQPLSAGDVVMSGALGPMFNISSGDALTLSIGGLGRVRCRIG
jgi:2-keto-4-pentenoate hydratase